MIIYIYFTTLKQYKNSGRPIKEIDMLISQECYKGLYLEGKSEDELMAQTQVLHREIERLKRIIESPAYYYENHPYPDEAAQIIACRRYLAIAKEYVLRVGEYSPTPIELASEKTDALIEKIEKITLTAGRYLEKKFQLIFKENIAVLRKSTLEGERTESEIERPFAEREIYELHMGEWRDNYQPEDYGASLNEPLHWQVRIDYTDSIPPKFFEGAGVFPYNFDRFAALMGASDAI